MQILWKISGCIFLLLLGLQTPALARETKKGKTGPQSQYERFFAGKTKTTVDGCLRLHQIGGKVYAEFPLSFLGREWLFCNSIESVSDNGEGVVGQFVGRNASVCFTLADTSVSVRWNFLPRPQLHPEAVENEKAIQTSFAGAVCQKLPVQCYTPDSSAIVIELTPLWIEHSRYTTPFPEYAGNSGGGMIERIHRLRENRSFIRNIRSTDQMIAVQCDLGYDEDMMVFGTFPIVKDYPLTVTVNRMLRLLPKTPMPVRKADPRVATSTLRSPDFTTPNRGVTKTHLATRWRIEPADSVAFRNGEPVTPKNPIVFYLDNALPAQWKPYIRAGVLAWNRAFEPIGFRNVISAQDFPANQPNFNPNDATISTIRYAPTSMPDVETALQKDPRTGEVLQASICIHNGWLTDQLLQRAIMTMGADPAVRRKNLSADQIGELLQGLVTHAVGKCLGLSVNCGASSVYPVDSLVSPTFTRTRGLSPSIMDLLTPNYVASPEAVAAGTQLVQTDLGPFDYTTIAWLYTPDADPDKLEEILAHCPDYRYGKTPSYFARFDPSSAPGDLGDDPVQSMRYFIQALRRSFPAFMEWYHAEDDDLTWRAALYQGMDDAFRKHLGLVMQLLGGVYLNEVREGDAKQTVVVVPRAKQQEAFLYLCDLMRDLSWFENREIEHQLEISNARGISIQERFCKDILSRIDYMDAAARRDSTSYTPQEFLNDVYAYIWEGTLAKRPLTQMEIQLQTAFVGSLLATTDLGTNPELKEKKEHAFRDNLQNEKILRRGFDSPAPLQTRPEALESLAYDLLLRSQALLLASSSVLDVQTQDHYAYLRFKIKQRLSYPVFASSPKSGN